MKITISEITFLDLEDLLDLDYIFLSNKNNPIGFANETILYSTSNDFRTFISNDYITIPSLDISIHIAYIDSFDTNTNEYMTDCSGYYIRNTFSEYFELESNLSSSINNFINHHYKLRNINIINLKYNLILHYLS